MSKDEPNDILYTGYDPVAYISTLSALEKDQMLGKLVILSPPQGQDTINDKNNFFSLPRLNVGGIFMNEKLPPAQKKLSPLATSTYNSITSNGGLISPQSPARPVGRPIDPMLVRLLRSLLLLFLRDLTQSICF